MVMGKNSSGFFSNISMRPLATRSVFNFISPYRIAYCSTNPGSQNIQTAPFFGQGKMIVVKL